MNKNAILYIIRHGESEGNLKKITSGQTDHKITPLGERQALELGKKLKHVTFDKVFSSDLVRAKRTAELITLEKNLEIETARALRERSFGDLEGKPVSEIQVFFDLWDKLSNEERLKQRPNENAETEGEAMSRFTTFLREVAIAYPGKTILISTHGALIHEFLIHLGALTSQELKRINNTSWIKLESDGIDFQIKEMEGVVRA